MTTTGTTYVETELGRLHVDRCGTGRPIVLWHSLFVDSRSWGPLVDQLAEHGTVLTIDGPSHGRSEPVIHEFELDQCVPAAMQVLDDLGLAEPVHWVGNAWGGHVGLMLAARFPERLRTLATIGTPVQPFSLGEKLTKGWPLVELYRWAGPTRFILGQLSASLLGSEAVARDPELAATILSSFASADRRGMLCAMRSLMLHRTSAESLLPDVGVPTLVLSVRDDVMGWRPDEARRTCAAMPDCRVEEVAGTGHISPLLVDPDRVRSLLLEFWAAS
jgi:pimeloyl-ACP methyl ester carboxylesterase